MNRCRVGLSFVWHRAGFHHVWRLVAIGALAFAWPALSFADPRAEYQVKASYIYNFLQFVRFPSSLLNQQSVHVCILGQDRFGTALDTIDRERTPAGTILIRRLGPYRDPAQLRRCNLVYMLESERSSAPEVLARLDPRQVMTISEFSPFIEQGGLIELYRDGDNIRFRINTNLVVAAEFKVDAQLVELGVPKEPEVRGHNRKGRGLFAGFGGIGHWPV